MTDKTRTQRLGLDFTGMVEYDPSDADKLIVTILPRRDQCRAAFVSVLSGMYDLGSDELKLTISRGGGDDARNGS